MGCMRLHRTVALVLFSAAGLPAGAQVLYNYLSADVTRMIERVDQTNLNHMMDSMLAQQLAIQHEMGVMNIGQMKIAAGQATTKVGSAPEAAFAARVDAGQRTLVRRLLDGFEAALRDRQMQVRDSADGQALALVLAYYGYRGEDPGPVRLAKLRAQFREQILTSAAIQGHRAALRQEEYERLGFFAMMSVAARNAAQ